VLRGAAWRREGAGALRTVARPGVPIGVAGRSPTMPVLKLNQMSMTNVMSMIISSTPRGSWGLEPQRAQGE
jgi:hypothetical protein